MWAVQLGGLCVVSPELNRFSMLWCGGLHHWCCFAWGLDNHALGHHNCLKDCKQERFDRTTHANHHRILTNSEIDNSACIPLKKRTSKQTDSRRTARHWKGKFACSEYLVRFVTNFWQTHQSILCVYNLIQFTLLSTCILFREQKLASSTGRNPSDVWFEELCLLHYYVSTEECCQGMRVAETQTMSGQHYMSRCCEVSAHGLGIHHMLTQIERKWWVASEITFRGSCQLTCENSAMRYGTIVKDQPGRTNKAENARYGTWHGTCLWVTHRKQELSTGELQVCCNHLMLSCTDWHVSYNLYMYVNIS